MTCDGSDFQTLDFFPGEHDPSGALQGPWRILVQCDTGVQPNTATVIAVDEDNHPIAFDATGVNGDSLVISLVTIVAATDQILPNVWAIQFYTQYGSPKQIGYRVRGRYSLNTTPVTGRDKTLILACRQT